MSFRSPKTFINGFFYRICPTFISLVYFGFVIHLVYRKVIYSLSVTINIAFDDRIGLVKGDCIYGNTKCIGNFSCLLV